MIEIGTTQKRIIPNDHAVAMVLGLDLNKVMADSLTLEPLGTSGDWMVRWQGGAILDAEAAAILFSADE